MHIHTTEWLIRLYCEMGYTDRASELAETLPENISFDRYEAYGRIHIKNKKYLTARQEYEVRATVSMSNLFHSLIMCGNTYVCENTPNNAVPFYQGVAQLEKVFINIGLPISDSMRNKVNYCKDQIERISKQYNP